MTINEGKYFWKFKQLIPVVLSEQQECIVCGSKKNLNIHHILHSKSYEKSYADKNNLIVLCRDCHQEYHKSYSKSTPLTLLQYMRNNNCITKKNKKYEEEVNQLKRELREYQDLVNYIIQMT